MNENSNRKIMIGILICLIVIALKPVPFSYLFNNELLEDFVHEANFVLQDIDGLTRPSVLNLGNNKIALFDVEGVVGDILILEFNEEKNTFEYVGVTDYLEMLYEHEELDEMEDVED